MIKNREEIFEQFLEMLKEYEKNRNPYQTDVYAYFSEEQKVELEEFVNIGGNSWRNDDHFLLYTDQQHYETLFNCGFIENINDLASCLDLSVEQLFREAQKNGFITDEDATPENAGEYYEEACRYASSRDEYMELLNSIYIDSSMDFLLSVAELCIDKLEQEIYDRINCAENEKR